MANTHVWDHRYQDVQAAQRVKAARRYGDPIRDLIVTSYSRKMQETFLCGVVRLNCVLHE